MHDVLAHLVLALVAQGDADAGVQKGCLAHALEEHFVVILGGLKDLGVGLEADGRAALVGAGHRVDLFHGLAALKAHHVLFLAVAHGRLHPQGQGVDDRRAHAVQAADTL